MRCCPHNCACDGGDVAVEIACGMNQGGLSRDVVVNVSAFDHMRERDDLPSLVGGGGERGVFEIL